MTGSVGNLKVSFDVDVTQGKAAIDLLEMRLKALVANTASGQIKFDTSAFEKQLVEMQKKIQALAGNTTISFNTKGMDDAVEKVGKKVKEVSKGGKEEGGLGFEKALKSLEAVEHKMRALKELAIGIATVGFGVEGLAKAAELSKGYQSFQFGVRGVSRDAAAADAHQRELYQLAQDTHQPLESLGELDAVVMRNSLGRGQNDGIKETRAVAQLLAIQQAQSGRPAQTYSLMQVLNNPRPMANDVNAAMVENPLLDQYLMAGLRSQGFEIQSNKDIESLVAMGKINGSHIHAAFKDQAPQIEQLYKAMPQSVGASFQNVTNSFTQFFGKLDQESGISASISVFVQSIAKQMDKAMEDGTFTSSAKSIGEKFQGILLSINDFIQKMLEQLAPLWNSQAAAADKNGDLIGSKLKNIGTELTKAFGEGNAALGIFEKSLGEIVKKAERLLEVLHLMPEGDQGAPSVRLAPDGTPMPAEAPAPGGQPAHGGMGSLGWAAAGAAVLIARKTTVGRAVTYGAAAGGWLGTAYGEHNDALIASANKKVLAGKQSELTAAEQDAIAQYSAFNGGMGYGMDGYVPGTRQARDLTNAPRPYVIGDSIAKGVISANAVYGQGVVGANPSKVFGMINATPQGTFQGQNVVLSTGASNGSTPDQLAMISQQLDALKNRGAASITVLGVADARFPGVNDALAKIAKEAGVRFTGPLQGIGPDGVHPTNYRGLGVLGRAAPDKSVPEPEMPEMARATRASDMPDTARAARAPAAAPAPAPAPAASAPAMPDTARAPLAAATQAQAAVGQAQAAVGQAQVAVGHAQAAAGAHPGVVPSTAPGIAVSGVPSNLLGYYQEASSKFGIPLNLLLAQSKQESGFNQARVGGSGEIGLMQIMPSTARDPGYNMQGVDPATLKNDPRANIMFGAQYLVARMTNGGKTPINWSDQAQVRDGLGRYNGGGDPKYAEHVTGHLTGGLGSIGGVAGAPITGDFRTDLLNSNAQRDADARARAGLQRDPTTGSQIRPINDHPDNPEINKQQEEQRSALDKKREALFGAHDDGVLAPYLAQAREERAKTPGLEGILSKIEAAEDKLAGDIAAAAVKINNGSPRQEAAARQIASGEAGLNRDEQQAHEFQNRQVGSFQSWKEISRQYSIQADDMDRLTSAYGQGDEAIRSTTAHLQAEAQIREVIRYLPKEQADALREQARAQAELTLSLEKSKEVYEMNKNYWQGIVGTVEGGVNSVFFGGKKMSAALRDIVKSLGEATLKRFIWQPLQMAVGDVSGGVSKTLHMDGTGNIFSSAFKGIGSLFGLGGKSSTPSADNAPTAPNPFGGADDGIGAAAADAGSSGWLSSAFKGVGSWVTGLFAATGGEVGGGNAYTVGEAGPEIFIPGQNGSIVPAHVVRAISSGALMSGSQMIDSIRGMSAVGGSVNGGGNMQNVTNMFNISTPSPAAFAASKVQIAGKLSGAMRAAQRVA